MPVSFGVRPASTSKRINMDRLEKLVDDILQEIDK